MVSREDDHQFPALQAIGQFELSGGRPTYQQLDALIVKARQAKLDIFDVARAASSLAFEVSLGQDLKNVADIFERHCKWRTSPFNHTFLAAWGQGYRTRFGN